MRGRMVLAMLAVIIAHGATFPVTIRHDVDDTEYIELAKKVELAPGQIVTRPGAETPGSGVLIHPRYVLTAGHIGSVEGPADMPVDYCGKKYTVDHVYLFPEFKKARNNWGGYDIAILRLKGYGIQGVPPAVLWMKGLHVGQRFIGVGQGKSGTGRQNDEPIPARIFRGYENTIDYVFDGGDFNLLVADFDSPDGSGNSLSATLFFPDKRIIRGTSSAQPLPLEGSLAAGDSGGGIWAEIDGRYYLVGIATFRIYSCYAAQSYYVNISNRDIARWIVSVCPEVNAVMK